MRTNPWENMQHVFYKALHKFCCGTDMERHRRQSDRERRIVACQQMYVHRSQHLAGESQECAQETEEHS